MYGLEESARFSFSRLTKEEHDFLYHHCSEIRTDTDRIRALRELGFVSDHGNEYGSECQNLRERLGHARPHTVSHLDEFLLEKQRVLVGELRCLLSSEVARGFVWPKHTKTSGSR